MRALALVVASIVLLTACSSSQPARPATPPPEPTVSPRQAQFDQQYLDMMVGHHQASLEMARIALQRSQRQEIHQVAEAIVAEQPAEISDMQAWRAAWFGLADTPPLDRVPTLEVALTADRTPLTANLQGQIEQLNGAPEPFDAAFIDALAPIHQREVDASKTALLQAGHQELLDLAGEVMAAHVHELEQLHAWRSEWFNQ
jgi:uncharacterized protein (DUF305 family)